MSRIKTISLSGVTADADGIVVSVTPAAGGEQSLTIAGQPPQAIIVDITSVADETAREFVITGTDRRGNVITETVDGLNNDTAQSTKQFLSITSITVDDDTTGAITIGWAAVVYGPWIPLNTAFVGQVEVDINLVVSGTVNFDLEFTYGDLFPTDGSVVGDIEPNMGVVVDPDIDGDTASITKTITQRAAGMRLKVNSGTGSLAGQYVQAGNR